MPVLPCADACPVVASLTARLGRSDGAGEPYTRIGIGLSPVYVAAVESNGATAVCSECGQVYHGPGAGHAARECADFDR